MYVCMCVFICVLHALWTEQAIDIKNKHQVQEMLTILRLCVCVHAFFQHFSLNVLCLYVNLSDPAFWSLIKYIVYSSKNLLRNHFKLLWNRQIIHLLIYSENRLTRNWGDRNISSFYTFACIRKKIMYTHQNYISKYVLYLLYIHIYLCMHLIKNNKTNKNLINIFVRNLKKNL